MTGDPPAAGEDVTGVTSGGGRRPARVGSRMAAVATFAGCGLMLLLAAGRPWADGTAAGVLGASRVVATGGDAVPVLTPAALVLLASALALLFMGPRARRPVLVIGLVSAAFVAVAAAGALRDPGAALVGPAREVTGATGTPADGATAGIWPVLTLAACLATVLLAGAALRAARSWGPGRSAAAVGSGEVAPDAVPGDRGDDELSPLDAWQALSSGVDPTRDPGDASAG